MSQEFVFLGGSHALRADVRAARLSCAAIGRGHRCFIAILVYTQCAEAAQKLQTAFRLKRANR